MRNYISCLRQMLAVCPLLVMVLLPLRVSAQVPPERSLNGIPLNASANDVLNLKGTPHMIGPAMQSVDMIWDILDPLPIVETPDPSAAATGAGGPGMPGTPPPVPEKPKERYIVWLYEGGGKVPNPAAGWNTYVIFDKYGRVVGVVVAQTNPTAAPPVKTGTGITFSTRLTELISKYDWPDPFVKVGPNYFCAYPSRNITFSLDAKNRKVIAMALGLPVTVLPIASEKKEGDPNAPAPGPGGAWPELPSNGSPTPQY